VKRTIGIATATVAVAAGLLGSAAPASADDPQYGQPFVCLDVDTGAGGGDPSSWGRHCVNDIFVVPNGGTLCVAVRGSDGHSIVFRAFENNIWRGRPSRPLVAGAPRDCIFTNYMRRTVTVQLKARSNSVFGVDVQGMGYVE
jgi:hypothetical protein